MPVLIIHVILLFVSSFCIPLFFFFFFLMIRRPPRSTLFPYTDALPISDVHVLDEPHLGRHRAPELDEVGDRKSTRLNSSHVAISYAVFCLKKKNKHINISEHHSKSTELEPISTSVIIC